eukprot:m.81788 g.81788  ORF g.81788 m.81788 type:complete len:632 (+) comp12829_c0_seq1:106-2001(+)
MAAHIDYDGLTAELMVLKDDIDEIDVQIMNLQSRRDTMVQRRDVIKRNLNQFEIEEEARKARKDWGDPTLFSWSSDVEHAREAILGNNKPFRRNQQEVINATLSGRDAFNIMPTGGGKTLCFLIPTIVEKGVSLVVSPLISLMQDQLMSAKDLNIEARQLNSFSPKEEVTKVLQQLGEPNCPYNLLYVTPERIAKSKRLLGKLEKAHKLGNLKRIIIDEAHCCSEWGHDFRPDYQKMNIFKIQFPDVPIMALTATATNSVQQDVKKILNIPGCEVFKNPSHRQNLHYEIRQKHPNFDQVIKDIADYINTKYCENSGIIYCLSRKETSKIAQSLQSHGISARSYHADLSSEQRESVHRNWINNNIKVVVATTAFGLGINKPDVRFVIHHCISKSVESFYQESGRAGRDGKQSDSVLYYNTSDLTRQSTMVCFERVGIINLYKLIRFCENKDTCRRALLARHFGENYDANKCNGTCDNCGSTKIRSKKDVTDNVADLLQIIKILKKTDNLKTLNGLVDIWKGTKRKGLQLENAPIAPKSLEKHECERIIVKCLLDDILAQEYKNTAYSTNSYITLGSRAGQVLQGGRKVELTLENALTKPKEKEKEKRSSAKKRKVEVIVLSDDSDDDFEFTE